MLVGKLSLAAYPFPDASRWAHWGWGGRIKSNPGPGPVRLYRACDLMGGGAISKERNVAWRVVACKDTHNRFVLTPIAGQQRHGDCPPGTSGQRSPARLWLLQRPTAPRPLTHYRPRLSLRPAAFLLIDSFDKDLPSVGHSGAGRLSSREGLRVCRGGGTRRAVQSECGAIQVVVRRGRNGGRVGGGGAHLTNLRVLSRCSH